MGNPHTNKRERGHKRSNTQVEVEKAKKKSRKEEEKKKKKKLLNSKAAPNSVHIPNGDVSEEEEEEIPSGKLAFDTLLKKLGSGSDEKLTKLYKRIQREQEGISDSEEDDDDGSEKENGGLGGESDMDDIEDGDLREHAPYTINEHDEDETSSEDDAGSASNKEINTDDLIRTRKCIKLYGDYYSSDIIIASPLGLVTKIEEAEEEKEKDVDFLSSIEILVIDHADVIAMQNWSLLNSVVEQLNRTPTRQHGTDIMRIRRWYLNGHARFYRQTILLSSLLNSDMNILFSQSCMNYDGKVKLLSGYKGVLREVLLQVPQVYDRFDAPSIDDKDDARLDYFCKKVFPRIKDSMEGGTMLFISSYFEFYRIRIFLKSQNASFCWLGEYTKPEDISDARNWFFYGERKIILYTERAHFNHRYKGETSPSMIRTDSI